MIERADASRKTVDALIWIDHQQAIIALREGGGSPLIERLGRGAFEPEAAFEARAVDELVDFGPRDCDRTGVRTNLVRASSRVGDPSAGPDRRRGARDGCR